MQRRTLLKRLTGSLALLLAGPILQPFRLWAAQRSAAFSATDQQQGMAALLGPAALINGPRNSTQIKVKAPDIVSNPLQVPVSINTTLEAVASVSVWVKNNPTPLAAEFELSAGVLGNIATRLQMAKTSRITALVNTAQGAFQQTKRVYLKEGICPELVNSQWPLGEPQGELIATARYTAQYTQVRLSIHDPHDSAAFVEQILVSDHNRVVFRANLSTWCSRDLFIAFSLEGGEVGQSLTVDWRRSDRQQHQLDVLIQAGD